MLAFTGKTKNRDERAGGATQVTVMGTAGGVGVTTLVAALNSGYRPAAATFVERSAEYWELATPLVPGVVVCRHTALAIDAAAELIAGQPSFMTLAVSCITPERIAHTSQLTLRALRGLVPVVVLPFVARMDTRGPSRSYLARAEALRPLAISKRA